MVSFHKGTYIDFKFVNITALISGGFTVCAEESEWILKKKKLGGRIHINVLTNC